MTGDEGDEFVEPQTGAGRESKESSPADLSISSEESETSPNIVEHYKAYQSDVNVLLRLIAEVLRRPLANDVQVPSIGSKSFDQRCDCGGLCEGLH
jgi:hypothetical protein